MLKDSGFRIESASASAALHAAKELSEWMSNPENIPATVAFSEQLTTSLQLAIAKHPVNRCEREKVWGSFHKLRCSEAFKAEWEGFLHRSTTIRPDPTFYQYVVGVIFKQILKLHCQIVGSARTQEDCHLSYEDKNAVRYAAGYVPRALAKKLRKSAHPLKEELTLCLFELVDDDGDDSHDESQDWVNMIDRGGLKHVNNTTYMVFASMELVVRRYIQLKMPANFKQDTKDHVLRDEDVLSGRDTSAAGRATNWRRLETIISGVSWIETGREAGTYFFLSAFFLRTPSLNVRPIPTMMYIIIIL